MDAREKALELVQKCLDDWPYAAIRVVDIMTRLEQVKVLLKAQEPDETRLVRHYSRPNVYADLWLHCEKCGGRVDDRYKPKFCPECGKKVKWE